MKSSQLYSGTATTNFNTIGLDLGDLTLCSFQADFSSAGLGGTLTLQGSNDNTTWAATASAVTVTSGATQLINLSNAGYRYARLAWVNSAGTGTCIVQSLVKESVVKGA